MPKVLFFTNLASSIAKAIIKPAPADFDVSIHSMSLSGSEKTELMRDADFVILFPGRLEDEAIQAAQNLRLIQLVSAGYDQMNLELCQAKKIPIANNGGANAIDVAEHTVAMILAYYRRFRELDPNVRADNWRAIDTGLTTYTLEGKTLGLIGFGKIGQRVAHLLGTWGVELLYADAYPAPPEVEQKLNVARVELDDLLQRSDVVSLHVPLLPDTREMINAQTLSLMKPTALLVNTCRGPVIDEPALAHALQTGQIAGAALDVLVQEPPDPQNPLLQLENVLLSPHTAGITFDTWERRGRFIFQNLQLVWDGQPPQAVVG
ncbi:MAG: 2-hydroxyacid dehydrogenase [Chloroflexota bacterium]